MSRKKKPDKGAKIIMVDIPWDFHFGRQVQRGISRYAWPSRPWVLHQVWQQDFIERMQDADTVGIISMRRPEDCAADAGRYGLAAVGVGKWSPECKALGLAYVDIDPKAIGEAAAEHFIERGFRNFGMFAHDEHLHSRHRGEAFVAALRRKKLTCDVFDRGREYPPHGEPLPAVSDDAEQIRRWLAGLPKPLGVFCIDDSMGLWVCEVCRRTGVHVPEEVAVLSADDDDMICSIVYPHLSSVAVPAEQVGFEAAGLLDAMLSGRKAPKRPILLPPMGVATRHSTDVMAIEDTFVVEAVRFIRENAQRGIRVEEVAAAVSMSRRALERRFRKFIGRSPFAEIRRVQIENIKMILARTDRTLEAMAPECGFESVMCMSLAFKKAVGTSPGAYRKQFQKH